ncbi:SDR family NAD(P)-dependent oxidoreductase [Streptomyces californicus]
MEGWRPGPTEDRGARRYPAEAGDTVRRLLADAEEAGQVYGAS